jgi:hypothetical protein
MGMYGAARSRPTHRTAPGDRPRQPTEDPVSWALATGRIGPEREYFWRRQVAAAAQAATNVLECLAAGCAVPLTAAGRPYTVQAAGPPPAGADPRAYAANPLLDDLREAGQAGSTVYAAADRFAGEPPTLFETGDVPPVTASGLDPRQLLAAPWYARHPLAAAATPAEAAEILDDVSGPGHLTAEYRAHVGNADYESRVREWAMRGVDADAAAADRDEAARALRVAASAVGAGPADDDDDDLIYDRVFGAVDAADAERELERLVTIASGGSVDTGITQREARAELEQLARSGGTIGTRHGELPVPPDLAKAALAQVDRKTR